MQKNDLIRDLRKTGESPFVTEKDVSAWLGKSAAYAREHLLNGLEQFAVEKKSVYHADDIADAVMSKTKNNRKMRGEQGMQKKELIEDLKETFGCSFMTAAELAQWTGRSYSFVKKHIVNDLPVMGKLYFVNDIADRVFELRRSW